MGKQQPGPAHGGAYRKDWAAEARQMGAKLDKAENGLWRLLDMPDTVFWWAFFVDEQTAGYAFMTYRFGSRSDDDR